jgi:hypothetical protein
MSRCTYTLSNGKRCLRSGEGKPALCDKHLAEVMAQEEIADNPIVTQLLSQPAVANLFDRLGSVLDRLGSSLESTVEKAAAKLHNPPPMGEAPATGPVRLNPRVVLGFPPDMTLTEELIKKRKRELARIYHPDGGQGNTEAMSRLNWASDLLLKTLRGK